MACSGHSPNRLEATAKIDNPEPNDGGDHASDKLHMPKLPVRKDR
jgi:hypothetical protein